MKLQDISHSQKAWFSAKKGVKCGACGSTNTRIYINDLTKEEITPLICRGCEIKAKELRIRPSLDGGALDVKTKKIETKKPKARIVKRENLYRILELNSDRLYRVKGKRVDNGGFKTKEDALAKLETL